MAEALARSNEDVVADTAGIQPKILVVDDDQGARDALQVILEDDYSVTLAASGQEALSLCMQASFDVVFLDVTMPELDGIEVLKRLKSMDESMDVVMISASDKAQKAVQSIKLGAYDYITKPFEPDEILSAVSRVLEKRNLQRENRYLRSEVAYAFSHNEIITQNTEVARILELVRKVAPTTSSILIAGESGTGKELVARCLHRWSNRRDGPFVAINCAAIPGELMESELFGHERGAFTGAHNRSIGKFEYADGGTLFLDEIAALRLDLQAKLLRVIQEKEINRLGSNRNIKVDVRIVAASNTDLEKSIRNGTFRQDLYFRLNVIPIKLPPLRERLGDVPILAQHFVAKFNKQVKRQVLGFTPRALEALERYPWPGNIRELENLVERLVVLGRDNEPIAYEDLPLELILDSVAPPETTSGERNGLLQARENFE
ncbi:MAG: sigma-54-dependent Fis family transcriptional regulator, partial [Deltaproteobacteria bacterium]|nr:sigma-54-dependent Fis family transcriptional regulator [Deltaproteobacteria bacterium]